VQLTVAIDLPAVGPGLPDQPGLPGIFASPLAQRKLLPSLVAAGLHSQATAHRPWRDPRFFLHVELEFDPLEGRTDEAEAVLPKSRSSAS
jgi:hypothetical protein